MELVGSTARIQAINDVGGIPVGTFVAGARKYLGAQLQPDGTNSGLLEIYDGGAAIAVDLISGLRSAVSASIEDICDDPIIVGDTGGTRLTGTVATVGSSATLDGTGTAFTTELSIGSVIDFGGGLRRTVIAIASATSLTMDSAINIGSGKTAYRLENGIFVRLQGAAAVGTVYALVRYST